MFSARTSSARPERAAAGFALVLILATAYTWWGWIGYIGADDVFWYYGGARGWLDHFPFVGGHGTIRHTLNIPMALSVVLLGPGIPALVLPGIIYGVALLGVIYIWCFRNAGQIAALATGVALVSMPMVAVQMSIANIDIVECAFVIPAILILAHAVQHGPRFWPLLASGGLLALGFLSRETSAFAVAGVVVMFLLGFGIPRKWYFVVGAGFLAVWAIDVLYLAIMTGDPLFRMNIARNHDPGLNRAANLEGNLLVHPVLDPLLVLLVNQEFALLFWLGIPATASAVFSNVLPAGQRLACKVPALFALVWFLGVSLLDKSLVLNPRYFMLSALLVAAITAWVGVALWRQGRKKTVTLAAALWLAGNALGIIVENRDFSYGEFALRDAALAHANQVIRTDQHTWRRAMYLLSFEAIDQRATAGAPEKGQLFFVNRLRLGEYPAKHVSQCLANEKQWILLASGQPAPRFPFGIMASMGANKWMPGAIWEKLAVRHPGYALYRVTTDESASGCRLDKRDPQG